MPAPQEFLPRPDGRLPTARDFDPYGGDLDAKWAWDNFGGLSIERAYEVFIDRPEIYQEDFMFMGGRAFEYYFPVIDRYLREVKVDRHTLGDCEAWILGAGIVAQLNSRSARLSTRFLEEIDDLISFVRLNVKRYARDPKDRNRVASSWDEAKEELAKYRVTADSKHACRCLGVFWGINREITGTRPGRR